jgi:GMP synthase (glutamine-hydrolysing)
MRVLLLKPGVTSSKVLLGDYEVWFGREFGAHARIHPVELHEGQPVPALSGFDAVVMSGSPLSVTTPLPWYAPAADALLEAAARGLHVLGVCFGHQLLAWRLGGEVAKNPHGRELGTAQVTLTPEGRADALFRGLPPVLQVQATHEDAVTRLPDGARLLATNATCPVQAFGVGDRLRAVQFHPEMRADSIRYVIAREPSVDEPTRARLHGEALDADHGGALLRNFLALAASRSVHPAPGAVD